MINQELINYTRILKESIEKTPVFKLKAKDRIEHIESITNHLVMLLKLLILSPTYTEYIGMNLFCITKISHLITFICVSKLSDKSYTSDVENILQNFEKNIYEDFSKPFCQLMRNLMSDKIMFSDKSEQDKFYRTLLDKYSTEISNMLDENSYEFREFFIKRYSKTQISIVKLDHEMITKNLYFPMLIDEDIQPAIRLLASKGYLTYMCCSGHIKPETSTNDYTITTRAWVSFKCSLDKQSEVYSSIRDYNEFTEKEDDIDVSYDIELTDNIMYLSVTAVKTYHYSFESVDERTTINRLQQSLKVKYTSIEYLYSLINVLPTLTTPVIDILIPNDNQEVK